MRSAFGVAEPQSEVRLAKRSAVEGDDDDEAAGCPAATSVLVRDTPTGSPADGHGRKMKDGDYYGSFDDLKRMKMNTLSLDSNDLKEHSISRMNSQLWRILLGQEKERQKARLSRMCYERPRNLRHHGIRLTIFSEHFLRQIERFRGDSDVNRMLHTAAGAILQCVVFAVMVAMLGLTPIVKEAALWDKELGKKTLDFVPQTPYIMHFGMSVLIANAISWVWYGSIGLKDCWDFNSILYVSRVSVFYAIGESMELFTLLYLDSTSWKVVNQLKLPLTALLNFFCLRRRQTPTQWALIVSISLAVLAYLKATSSDDSAEVDVYGISLGVVNVLIVTVAGVVADCTYKEVKYPFFILVAQGRLSACICTAIGMLIYEAWKGEYKWFFSGWTFRTMFLTFWLLAKDWAVTFVLKNLDSMWKAIGTALGLCVTYVMSNLILQWNLSLLVMVLVLFVVVNIVAYTFTRHEEHQRQSEIRTLEKQIQDQQVLLNTHGAVMERSAANKR